VLPHEFQIAQLWLWASVALGLVIFRLHKCLVWVRDPLKSGVLLRVAAARTGPATHRGVVLFGVHDTAVFNRILNYVAKEQDLLGGLRSDP